MKMKEFLQCSWHGLCDEMQEVDVVTERIQVVFVNETVPVHPQNDFYSSSNSMYAQNVSALLSDSSLANRSLKQLIDDGFYFTNLLKKPKQTAVIEKEIIRQYAEVLNDELSCFVNCKVIMLMGDAAIQAYACINRSQGKKRCIPAGSTYKLRKQLFMNEDIRVMPSYIMTGKNLMIEKSKIIMIREDINEMLTYLLDNLEIDD